MTSEFKSKADHLRRVSGSTSLETVLRNAVQALVAQSIPSLVVGGYAVQEHGYFRYTGNVDLIVPDVVAARGWLPVSEWVVNLLPGGQAVRPGPLKLPMPTGLTNQLTIADLRTLLDIKMSKYLGRSSAASRTRRN